MNQQMRKSFYPTISYNSKNRCERRWDNDANNYDDIDSSWQISIGNGWRDVKPHLLYRMVRFPRNRTARYGCSPEGECRICLLV